MRLVDMPAEIPADRWFQGPTSEPPPGRECLAMRMGSICWWRGWSAPEEARRLAAIIARLFPERTTVPDGIETAPGTIQITFNDHPATTLADVNKVLHTWVVERG